MFLSKKYHKCTLFTSTLHEEKYFQVKENKILAEIENIFTENISK